MPPPPPGWPVLDEAELPLAGWYSLLALPCGSLCVTLALSHTRSLSLTPPAPPPLSAYQLGKGVLNVFFLPGQNYRCCCEWMNTSLLTEPLPLLGIRAPLGAALGALPLVLSPQEQTVHVHNSRLTGAVRHAANSSHRAALLTPPSPSHRSPITINCELVEENEREQL
ncbi:unnamed protein product [Arctogadus glacialis]